MVRNAETMPLVTVILSPRSKGYPSAATSSPSRTEVANGSTVSVRDGVTLSSAMSRAASDAMTVAVLRVPLSNTTVMRDCPFMTCSLVRI